MGNFISDGVNAFTSGVGKVANSARREVDRGLDETVENIDNDFDSIATAIDKGGLLGGLVQAADVFSPGHQVANGLDAWNVIPEDPALKELVSGGVNFMIPGITPWKLLAIKDVADAIGEIKNANTPVPAPAASQAAESPTAVTPGTRGFNADDITFGDRIHGMTCGTTDAGGVFGGSIFNAFGDRLKEAIERFKRTLVGKGEQDEIGAEIDKILSNPNLCFEDMIFLLMRALIKDTRNQVTDLAGELRTERRDAKSERAGLQKELADARADFASVQGSKDPSKIQAAQNKVSEAQEKLTNHDGDGAEARADKFEELKQIMQRLSEMEQALSNVLNTMHESSMAAIRNIR